MESLFFKKQIIYNKQLAVATRDLPELNEKLKEEFDDKYKIVYEWTGERHHYHVKVKGLIFWHNLTDDEVKEARRYNSEFHSSSPLHFDTLDEAFKALNKYLEVKELRKIRIT